MSGRSWKGRQRRGVSAASLRRLGACPKQAQTFGTRAWRIARALKATEWWIRRSSYWAGSDVLGIVEAVRVEGDPEWYYVVLIHQPERKDWSCLVVWRARGRDMVNERGNALSWNGGVVELMSLATRLKE